MTDQSLLESICAQNLAVYRASPIRLREDVGQEAEIAHDYRGRLVYELLQNADDAMAGHATQADSVWLRLTDSDLWVGNSGRPLDEDDVRGLCGIGASSKGGAVGRRRASIGHKGMGFKSVLEITDAPQVISETYAFELGRHLASDRIAELMTELGQPKPTRVPAMRFPQSLAERPPEWESARERQIRTLFRFPLRADLGGSQRAILADRLLSLPATAILFLKHLEHIEVDVQTEARSENFAWSVERQRRDRTEWVPASGLDTSGIYRITVGATHEDARQFVVAHSDELEIGTSRAGLDEYAWAGVDLSEVSVAAELVDDAPTPVAEESRVLHLFLPTAEVCPYPLLINGAFSADLSRQEVRVTADPDDYNRWLLRCASRLFCDELVSACYSLGASELAVIGLLDRETSVTGEAAPSATGNALVTCMREALLESPIVSLPNAGRVPLTSCVVPPLVDDADAGAMFRELLPESATHAGRAFPVAELCGGRAAHVIVDHGASELAAAETPGALTEHDLSGARLVDHETGGVYIDPVLKVLEHVWSGLAPSERPEFELAVRSEPLFPTDTAEHGVVRRIVVAGKDCFYPPRALSGSVPLDGLCFLSRDICWGALMPKERLEVLHDEMAIWQAMFGVREFKFPDVMRTSVLPALTLPDEGGRTEEWTSLCEPQTLAAVCQLSGRTPNPGSPLPYERLGTNRALFNLSRLPVPCRTADPEVIDWQPAYRVYFGEDWIGDASIEHVLQAVADAGGEPVDIPLLVAPDRLVPLLARYQHLRRAADESDDDDGADEVELEEDEEEALDTTDRDRWLSFLTWLGVNHALRPVHFTDVEDRNAGWLTTKGLVRPRGWAFRDLPADLWSGYVDSLRNHLRIRGVSLTDTTPYFYEVHDLEYVAGFLAEAATDADCGVATALFCHLTENWPQLQRFLRAQVAAVPNDRVPSMRSKPRRAQEDERVSGGDNFWIWRLQQRQFCPTTHGPKAPSDTWIRTAELERRFTSRRGGVNAGQLLPVLDVPDRVSQKSRPLRAAVGVREEITSSSLRPEDADTILRRLADLYAGGITRPAVREVVRPTYRSLVELLPGQDADASFPPGALSHAPLLEEDGVGAYRFTPGGDVLWAERGGTRERLGNPKDLWTFVLEPSSAARVPLTRLFGVRVLEEQLLWRPVPGENALDASALSEFRRGVHKLAPFVLARLSADRTAEALRQRDAATLRRLIASLTPVRDLRVGCSLDDLELAQSTERAAFVDVGTAAESQRAFVVWGEHGWPPSAQEAEALATALSEGLGASHFEAFLALVNARDTGARTRLLSLAGVTPDLEAMAAALAEDGEDQPEDGPGEVTLPKVPGAVSDEEPATLPQDGQGDSGATVVMTPLYDPGELMIDGVPITVEGEHKLASENGKSGGGRSGSGTSKHGYGGRTDLNALDRLGMFIATQYELRRLATEGVSAPSIFDPDLGAEQPGACVFDVSTPALIARAQDRSHLFRDALQVLEKHGVDPRHPGCDILTLRPGPADPVDRLIELKSSGQHARTQAMTWNEWKTAQSDSLRSRFYLYLAANLRSDLPDASPFLRIVRDPYATMRAHEEMDDSVTRRVVLHVAEFTSAEELELGVAAATAITTD